MDFTVISSVRQRFGDTAQDDLGQELEAPFVGRSKIFTFQCPNVDSSQSAILLFQSQGVNVRQNLQINGKTVFGGIRESIELAASSSLHFTRAQWNGNIMLVHSGVLVDKSDNTLMIEAKELNEGNLDNFIIDNIVILFKTKSGGVLSPNK